MTQDAGQDGIASDTPVPASLRWVALILAAGGGAFATLLATGVFPGIQWPIRVERDVATWIVGAAAGFWAIVGAVAWAVHTVRTRRAQSSDE